MIPLVKICGVTTPADAAAAAAAGASAVGLVFWPSSPRAVDAKQARKIIAAVPAFVSVVGVFVNQVEEAARLARELSLSAVQFHGDETAEDCAAVGVRVIKSVALRDESAVAAALGLPEDVTALVDAHDPVRRGGTGTPVDWSLARAIARRRATILSGGLNPHNVAAALAAVRPWAIDVSSGVESAPGKKDVARILALFAAIGQGAERRP